MLNHAIMKLGGYVFLVTEQKDVDYYHDDGPNYVSDCVTHTTTLTQIDAPMTPRTAVWNKAARHWLAETDALDIPNNGSSEAENTRTETWVSVTAASPELIVAAVGANAYTLGRPHGVYAGKARNWSMKLGRTLTLDDIFAPRTDGTN